MRNRSLVESILLKHLSVCVIMVAARGRRQKFCAAALMCKNQVSIDRIAVIQLILKENVTNEN